MHTHCSNYSVSHLELTSNLFWREIKPSSKACSNLKKLLEVYASQEEWEKVISLSSRAVLHLTKNYDKAEFYHIWICALNETYDFEALVLLGKHLIKMRFMHPVFIALALLSFHFAGYNKTCLKIFKHIKEKIGIKDRFYFECCGVYLANYNASSTNIQKGIDLIKKTCHEKKSNYFSWRNFLRVLSQLNRESEMAWVYNSMNLRFPFAQEPYLVSALIAFDNKEWDEAKRILKQIINDNSYNTNAILALSQCYAEKNEYSHAITLLAKNSEKFMGYDYDYYFLMGHYIRKILEQEMDKDLFNTANHYLERSLFIANSLHFPISSMMQEIKILQGLLKSNKEKTQEDELILKRNLRVKAIPMSRLKVS